MLTALSTALSALNAQATAIDVVGNNLANLNTTGYKASSTEFYDLVSQTMGEGGNTQIGLGVGTPLTKRSFTNGQIQGTSSPLDCAIQGSGFLIVKDASNATLYTRAGDLKTDANGNLMDATGALVQGWTANNGVINTSSPIGNLVIPMGSLKAPIATQTMNLTANLDSRATAVAPASQTSANTALSTGVKVYDSLGNAHVLTVNFWNNGGNSWNWQATIPGSEVGSASANVAVGSGSLTFNSAGQLTSPSATSAAPQLTISGLVDGASNMNVKFDLYDNNSSPLITQFAQTSSPSAQFQDGSPSAQLSKVGIGNGGAVVATFSDGQTVTMGQLAMANFVNPDSLIAVGNNAFQTSGASSLASIGLPGSGGRGNILGSSLESSTVDIATEFTNLMVGQRSYQANAKVVTSADQINQTTIELIR